MERGKYGVFGKRDVTSTQYTRDSQTLYTNAETAANYAHPFNLLSVNSLFVTGVNSALVDVDSMARFLYTFVKKTRSFIIYLGPYTEKDSGTIVSTTHPGDTEPAWIGWQSFHVSTGTMFKNEGYKLGYLGDVGFSYYIFMYTHKTSGMESTEC